jgi:hypothetical protein
MRTRIPLSLAAATAAVVVLLASCQSNPPSGERRAAQLPPPVTRPATASAKHSIQGQQLKAAMQEIARLHASLPKDLPEDVESPTGRQVALAAASAATAANNLAGAAVNLPRALEGKPLGEAERRGFVAFADTLHDQAIRLRGDAEKMRVEQMQQSMDAVTTTCVACHTRYRDLTGNVDVAKSLMPSRTPADPAGNDARQ